MKQTLEEAIKESIHKHYNCNGTYPCSEREYCEHCNGCNTAFDCNECGADEFKEGFITGAKWQKSQIPEHISTVQDCELAVRETKEKAIETLKKVLDNRMHISQALRTIAEFEELINK